MGLFKRKTCVTPEAFIAHEAEKSVTKKPHDIRELFVASQTEVKSNLELTIFTAFMPLLAMRLAHFKENIQSGYTAQVALELERIFTKGTGEHYQERVIEYLAAFDKDIAEGKTHLAPATITAALNNIVGKSDKSVVLCRMGLVKVLLPTLEVDVDFFKELKFG